MDEELNLQWVRGTLIPVLKSDDEEKVLFADNVCFQLSKEFHDISRRKINTVVYMLPAHHTDKVQPIVDTAIDFQILARNTFWDRMGDTQSRWDETPDLDAVIRSFRHRNLERFSPATVFSNWSVNDLRSFLKAMKRSKGTSSMKKEQVPTSTHLSGRTEAPL